MTTAEQIFRRCLRLMHAGPDAERSTFLWHHRLGAIWITGKMSQPQEVHFVEFAIPVGDRTLVVRMSIEMEKYTPGNAPPAMYHWVDDEPTGLEMAEMRLML